MEKTAARLGNGKDGIRVRTGRLEGEFSGPGRKFAPVLARRELGNFMLDPEGIAKTAGGFEEAAAKAVELGRKSKNGHVPGILITEEAGTGRTRSMLLILDSPELPAKLRNALATGEIELGELASICHPDPIGSAFVPTMSFGSAGKDESY